MRIFDTLFNRVNPGQFFFGGGGAVPAAPAPQKPITIPEPPKIEMPKAPKPLPPPPPPPTASALDQEAAGQQVRKDQQRRRGVAKSILAGETGGYNSATGKASLLG